ncbi:MAG: protein kinase [Acidobacteria bacterium]|nr:protein kinase [Acidobacteriota bacterium]
MTIGPGTRLGAYEILSLLGAGGMGEVYKARDTRLDRLVAVKLVTGGSAEADERLRHEARAAAALNHPHICTIHEIADAENRLFIVMEHVQGRLLSELAVEGLPLSSALRYGAQIADALSHAHERGVVHRDLKSTNLMVTADGRVKVLDFGIAHRLHVPGDAMTELVTTTPETAAGTVPYMAPEVLRGGTADHRSDIWALGVVLHELAAGSRPFRGAATFEIASSILRDDPEPLPAALPAAYRAIVKRCLAKEPAFRYQSAGEVRAALELVAADAPAATNAPILVSPPVADMCEGTPEKSVLVLPFANLSHDVEDAYFADGLTDELITDLSVVPDLRVVPAAASFRPKTANRPLADIAREFNVVYVVEGRVRKAGETVRITAQLVDVSRGRTLWADKFAGDLTDVFALQERVSQAIAGALQLRLRPPQRAPKPEAADAYLRGRHYARQATTAGLRSALEWFELATNRDPEYGAAFAAAAEMYVKLTMAWDARPARDAMARALAAAERALQLAPTLSEAHLARALVATFFEWDIARAESAFREALRLNPNSAVAHNHYGAAMMWLDTRCAEALDHASRAIALDPTDPWFQVELVWVHIWSRAFDRAVDHARQVVEFHPFYGYAHFALGCALAMRFSPEAIASLQRSIELDGRAAHHVALLGFCHALAGARGEALSCLRELETLEQGGSNIAAWKLYLYAGLGDAEGALRSLETAITQRISATVFMVSSPCLDFVRRDPRFVALVHRMGLGHLADRTWAVEWRPAAANPAGSAIRSLAVLPLVNLSRDSGEDYFADGMTEALIANLARIGALRVISRTSIMQYKDARKPLPQIARELNVDAIVEGSALRADGRIRITAQLIHAASDTHLWAGSYERDLRDVLALQSDVARAIAQEIRIQVTPQEQARLAAVRQVDPDVYALYLQGRYYWNRAGEARFRHSIEYFEQAIARDPNYAPAHAGVADYYNVLAWFGWARPHDVVPKAKAAARRALDLDDTLVEAHAALGYTAIYYDWDWDGAERELKRAIDLNPGYAMAHQYQAWYFGMHGRMAESIAASERARTLDPLSVLLNVAVGQQYFLARDYDRALAQFQHALEMDPNAAVARWSLAWVYLQQRRFDDAIRELEKVLNLTGEEFLPWLGYAYALARVEEKARGVLETLLSKAARTYVPPDDIGRIYVALGDADMAFEWLDRAVHERSGWVPWLAIDPSMDPLRTDARFAALLRRVGLKESESRSPIQSLLAPVRAQPTVGRAADRAALQAAFDVVASGLGLLVGIAGEPGLGKTTLVEDFLTDLRREGRACTVARGRCSERLAGTEAYLPVLEALDSLARSDGQHAALLRTVAPTWHAQVAPLKPEDFSGNYPIADVKSASQERLKREFVAFLREAGRLQPLVLFLDDVHWADASTVDALSYLAAHFDTTRAFVIVTYRPADLALAKHPFAALKLELQAKGTGRDLPVSFLTRDDVAGYLDLLFPDHCFQASFASLVHDKTEGNPLFMTDLLRYLRDRGVIARIDGRWALTAELPGIEREVPATVLAMIQRTVDRLDDKDRRLLTAASVQGTDFQAAVIARALGADAADIEEQLESIARVHALVRLVRDEELPDRSVTRRYRFVHTLYQNVLYGSLAPARLTALSRAVANGLIAFHGVDTPALASELACLFEAGRDFDRAARYFHVAARQAGGLSANQEVVALAGRGLAALTALPEGAERCERELQLLLTQGTAQTALHGWSASDVEETFRRAEKRSADVGETPALFHAVWGVFAYHYVAGHFQAALDTARQLVHLAVRLDSPVCQLHAHWATGATSHSMGDFSTAVQALERSLRFEVGHDRREVAVEYGQDPVCGVKAYLETALTLLGFPERAMSLGREAVEAARALNHPFSLAYTQMLSAHAHLLRDDMEGALSLAREAKASADRHDFGVFQRFVPAVTAIAEYNLGNRAALLELDARVAEMTVAGVALHRTGYRAWLAEAYATEGHLDRALEHTERASQEAEEHREGLYLSQIVRIKGDILRRLSDTAGAEACYRDAIGIAQRQRAKLFELRAAIGLADLLKDVGRGIEARALVGGIYVWFTEGFETVDLRRARALLDDLGRR